MQAKPTPLQRLKGEKSGIKAVPSAVQQPDKSSSVPPERILERDTLLPHELPDRRGQVLLGAQILWEALIRENVDVVFGYPGGAIMPAYDSMLQYPIRHVLVRHEQGAANMADGYARASGRVGVAVATSGPGATNLVTGIANA